MLPELETDFSLDNHNVFPLWNDVDKEAFQYNGELSKQSVVFTTNIPFLAELTIVPYGQDARCFNNRKESGTELTSRNSQKTRAKIFLHS